MRNASPVMGPSSTQGATRTAPPPHAAKLPPKSPQLPVTEDRPNAPSFPCPASESETTWTHVKRLAGSHPSITFDSTQLSDALVWINVTTNTTAEWIAHQTTEAFPWDEAPRYLIRDRDRIYDTIVTRRLRAMGIRDKPTVSASPWQNGFAERLIGSIRRECADHIIVFGEAHLRRILRSYAC